jgi:DNA excision repair protein ERCC-1
MNGVRRPPVVQPKPNVVRPSTSSILVNRCQEGNKVLEHLRNVAWQYSDIVPDYQVGLTTGVLYLRCVTFISLPELRTRRLLVLCQPEISQASS